MAETAQRTPILDETGKAREWLDAGRGIAIWQSQEIGVPRSELLTPGDRETPPHWAYQGGKIRTITTLADALFYQPMNIVKSWSDTPAGHKAAERALSAMPDETRDAPIGRVYTTYTLHRYTLGSIVIRPAADGGTTLETFGDNHLVAVEYRIGIRQWSAIDKTAN